MTARFTVEKTLGKLAKWLRILGFDACSEPCGSIGSKAVPVSDRILLTRTRIFNDHRTIRESLDG